MLIRLLNSAPCAPAAERRRLWLDLGQTMSLGRSFATAEHRIYDDCYLPSLVLTNAAWGRQELVLTQHKVFNLRRFAPLTLVPRALQMDSGRIPVRFFLEFVLHDRAAPPAQQKGA